MGGPGPRGGGPARLGRSIVGGGLLLAILLGPEAAFLVIASVLTVQALFFADGGLLALGANIFNLGVFPAFVAYPFIYRRIVGERLSPTRVVVGSIAGALVGLSLGALAVVLETSFSGISDLPFGTFLALMLPIHLAIAIVEGLVTAVVVLYITRLQPEILARAARRQPVGGLALRRVIASLAVAAVLTGGVLAWFASGHPDGLEWSISGVTRKPEFDGTPTALKDEIATVQEQTSFLPDYDFRAGEAPAGSTADSEPGWGTPSSGRSLAGLVGGGLTLLMAGSLGLVLRGRP
ncbi:MAG: cobalamin biosynthesis protein CbiM [Cyanobacteria bacterium K_Offshore_surface_m2_011]|nr:cobalamin biosynthesis protein CbiM [Cyanobacteria bacterium K_Offshore_surface_m2_011]